MDYQKPVSDKLKIAQKVIIIHPTDSSFLLLKRAKKMISDQDVYDIPGGNLAKMELHDLSLRREIKEETGLEVTDINPVVVQSRFISDNQVVFLYVGYAAIAKTTAVESQKGEDNSGHEWISPVEFEKKYGDHMLSEQVRKAFQLLRPNVLK